MWLLLVPALQQGDLLYLLLDKSVPQTVPEEWSLFFLEILKKKSSFILAVAIQGRKSGHYISAVVGC